MLAIDIGNSKTEFAVFNGDQIVSRHRLATAALTAENVAKFCSSLLADEAKTAFVASVVPAVDDIVADGAERAGTRVVRLEPNAQIMPNLLRAPAATGVDRLLAARAARDLYAKPDSPATIVIQAGTAVTVDAIDSRGCLAGGVILPGPRLWLEGLNVAARIPRFNAEKADWRILMGPVESWPGRDTREAVLHGMVMGLPIAIGAAGRALAQAVQATRYCLTGGWSEVLQPLLPFSTILAPDLVLHGIRLAAADLSR